MRVRSAIGSVGQTCGGCSVSGRASARRRSDGLDWWSKLAHGYQGRGFDYTLVKPPDVGERLEQWAVRRPNAPCLTTIGANGISNTLTYEQVYRSVQRMASWLVAEHDVEPGSVVVVLPRNDARSVALLLGVLRAGAVAFLIDPEERLERLRALLSAFTAAAVLAPDPTSAATVCGAHDVVDSAALPIGIVPRTAYDVRSPALYFGTSGSTATSKIVAQTRYGVAVNAEAVTRHHRLAPGVRILGCLPIHHVNGLNFSIFATLWAGSETVLVRSPRPELVHHAITTADPDIVSMVPTALDMLVLSELNARSTRLRYFLSAAAPLSANTAQAVWERFAVPVVQGYGLTEAVNFSTTMPTNMGADAYGRAVLDVAVPPIGVALFGNEVAILRPDGAAAGLDEPGEICVRGHNVMLGYVDNPDATQLAFEHGWLHTGDLGVRTRVPGLDTPVFRITGRLKNVAVVMGVSVSLEELETRIREVPGVDDAACVAVSDELRGQTVVAAVVATPNIAPPVYHRHLARYFSPLVLPSRWVAVPAIPRTATGKIIRRAMPQLVAPSQGWP